MGKKDTVTKNYMSEPLYFADAFNFYLFNGEQLIKANELCEKDSTELGSIFSGEDEEIIQKERDVLKQCVIMDDGQRFYLILGIENQSNIHYAMPVKNMIYDALNYGQQASKKAKEHRKKKDIQEDEFLSGFSKTDKLKPVITLVVYFWSDEWDAPRTLKEMLEEANKEVLQYVNDYKVNLLVPKEIGDFSKFKTDFGKVMKYISVSDDKEKCMKVANEEEYKIVSVESARLLNECVEMKIPIEKGEEKVNMCEAVKGIREDGRIEGRLEGRLEGIEALITTLQELGQTDKFIVEKIMEKFAMSEDEAKNYVK